MAPDYPTDPSEVPEVLEAGLAFVFGEDDDPDPPSVLERVARLTGFAPRVALRDRDPAPTPMLRPIGANDPARAGRYVVHGELGRGGVGAVHRGHDQELGRDVALKFLLERYRNEPEILQRFVEEAQIGGQLQHPGIVPVYDLGMAKGRPFFAMKLVKGDTLAKKLSSRESVASERRSFLAIFEDVCQTMAYAHARGVVHRDLKPANVMIGSFGEVQVVDWGLGKVLKQGGIADEAPNAVAPIAATVVETVRSKGDGSRSVVGSVMGTPAYMPPEQARGDVAAMDERSDVFALGAILCEILTGKPPYVGARDELIVMAASADLTSARERLASCGADPELIELADRCLAPAPQARPRSAEVLAHAVRDHLAAAEERVHTARVEAAEAIVRADALKRTQRLGLGLTAAIALGLVASLMLWRRSENSRILASENGARAVRELERAVEIKGLLADMLLGVTPERARYADTSLLRSILDDTAERLTSGAVENELVAAELHRLIGSVYHTLSHYDEAERHLTAAVETYESTIDEDDPRALEALGDLADLKKSRGRLDEARAIAEEVLARHTCDRGRTCDVVRHSVWTLVHVETTLGRFEEAEAMQAEVLAGLERDEGPEARRTLKAKLLLSAIRGYRGDLSGAERMHREILEVQERTLGPEAPDVLETRRALGAMWADQGRYEDARATFEELAAIQERLYPEDHLLPLATKLHLVDVYYALDRAEEARALVAEIRPVIEERMGEDHPVELQLRARLRTICAGTGLLAESERIGLELLKDQRRVLGEDHVETLQTVVALCLAQAMQGRPNETLAECEAAVETMRANFGVAHRATLRAMSYLANVYALLERVEEAEVLLVEYLTVGSRVLAPDTKDLLTARISLGLAREFLGRYDEAIESYQRAIDGARRTLGEESVVANTARHGLGTVLWRLGRSEEADELVRHAYDNLKRELPEDDVRLLRAGATLGGLCTQQENYAEAIELFEPYVAAIGETFDPQDAIAVWTVDTLARCYGAVGRNADAAALVGESSLEARLAAAARDDATPHDRNEAAWLLLTHPIEARRDPSRALELAAVACAEEEESGGASLWMYLDTLALAQFRTGDVVSAITTQSRAVESIPRDANPGIAAEVRERLAEFRTTED